MVQKDRRRFVTSPRVSGVGWVVFNANLSNLDGTRLNEHSIPPKNVVCEPVTPQRERRQEEPVTLTLLVMSVKYTGARSVPPEAPSM